MRAVVTGANGFVGAAVVRELIGNGYEVVAAVHSGQERLEGLDVEIVSYFRKDVSELSDIISGGCDVFYDLAWEGSAGPKRADVRLQLDNAAWTVDAMKAAKALGCTRFLHAGSIMEREVIAAAYSDGMRPGQGNIYGCGKATAHIMCRSAASEIGIDLIWPMITNAYGPGEFSPRLVNSTLRKCIDGISPEFTAATQNYDFVYIDDVARAFRLIGENGVPFTDYMIGSSGAKPLREFLLEMRDAVAPELEFHFGNIPFTGVSLPLEAFDCSKTEKDTGFRAEVSFAEGCRRTIDWLRTTE